MESSEFQKVEPKIVESQPASTINSEPRGEMVPANSPSADQQQWQEFVEPVRDFLADFPDKIGNFFTDYRQPLITLALIGGGLITVKFTLALLDAINSIFLLAPLLELVGLGYSGWFAIRYLLRSSTREELAAEIESFKQEIFGKNSSKS